MKCLYCKKETKDTPSGFCSHCETIVRAELEEERLTNQEFERTEGLRH